MFPIKKQTAVIIIIAAFLAGCCLTWFAGPYLFKDSDNLSAPSIGNTQDASTEKSVSVTMYCVEVNNDYEVLGNGLFTLEGTYSSDGAIAAIALDKLKIMDMEMPADQGYELLVQPALSVMDREMWVGKVYFAGLSSVEIEISRWVGAAVMRVDGRTFVASMHNSFTLEEFRGAYQYLFADFFELLK